MSEDEQITKEPKTDKEEKKKDPKKIEAGKRLQEYNRRAREALKRETEREADTDDNSRPVDISRFSTAISLIAVELTALDLFLRYFYKPKPEEVKTPKPEPPVIGMED